MLLHKMNSSNPVFPNIIITIVYRIRIFSNRLHPGFSGAKQNQCGTLILYPLKQLLRSYGGGTGLRPLQLYLTGLTGLSIHQPNFYRFTRFHHHRSILLHGRFIIIFINQLPAVHIHTYSTIRFNTKQILPRLRRIDLSLPHNRERLIGRNRLIGLRTVYESPVNFCSTLYSCYNVHICLTIPSSLQTGLSIFILEISRRDHNRFIQ